MPNWCSNFMTFFHNGTPEGELALKDFHDRIAIAIQKSKLAKQWRKDNNVFIGQWTCDDMTWEVDIEKEFGICINNVSKRGYILDISDISVDSFCLDCYDAWSANVNFWATLINYVYGDKISFTYQASEPGMCYYYTNDPAILPRYSFNMYASQENLIRLPNVWDTSGGLFWELNRNHPRIYESQYGISIDDFTERDDDELIEYFADMYNSNCESIDDIRNTLGDDIEYCLDPWEYYEVGDYFGEVVDNNKEVKKDG